MVTYKSIHKQYKLQCVYAEFTYAEIKAYVYYTYKKI